MATFTWTNVAGGDWSMPTFWSPSGGPGATDDALIAIPGTYQVNISTPVAVNSITLEDPTATLVDSGSLTLNSALLLSAGTLAVDGTIVGGTIVTVGGTAVFTGGTLEGAAFEGTLDLSPNASTITVTGGLTMASAGTSGPGAILLGGSASTLIFQDTQTVANTTIVAGNNTSWAYLDALASVPAAPSAPPVAVLTLGTDVAIQHTGSFFLIGSPSIIQSGSSAPPPLLLTPKLVADTGSDEIVNDGTITAALAGGDLLVANQMFTNAGEITASNGDTLVLWPTSFINLPNGTLAVGNGGTVFVDPPQFLLPGSVLPSSGPPTPLNDLTAVGHGSWLNEGTVTVASGGNLSFAGGAVLESPASLNWNATNQAVIASTGGTISVFGTLDNQNGTIDIGSGELALGGVLLGGVVTGDGTGSFGVGQLGGSFNPGTLDGVTVEGTLNFAPFTRTSAFTVFENGVTLEGAGGVGPASITLSTGNNLQFLGAATVDNATITVTAASADIFDRDLTGSGAVLTFGSHLAITAPHIIVESDSNAGDGVVNQGTLNLGLLTTTGRSLINAGTINLTGTSTFSAINSTTFTNATSGSISVGSNADLFIDSATWSNQGQISIAAKGTLNLLGFVTFNPETLTSISNSGGTVQINGTVALAGENLILGPQSVGSATRTVAIGTGATVSGVAFGLGSKIIGTGVISGDTGAFNYPGTIEASNGTLALTGTITDSALVIDTNANLILSGPAHTFVTFSGADGTLTVQSPTDGPTGTIAGLAPGDVINLVNTPVTSATFNGSTLTVHETSGGVSNYLLAKADNGDVVQVISDGVGGSDLIVKAGVPYSAFLNAAHTLSTDVSNGALTSTVLVDALDVYTTGFAGALGTFGNGVWQQGYQNTVLAVRTVSGDLLLGTSSAQFLSDTLNLYDTALAGVVDGVALGDTQTNYQTVLHLAGTLAADIESAASAGQLQNDLGALSAQLAGSNISSTAWQQAITLSDQAAATLSTDQTNGATTTQIQADVANLYDTVIANSLGAIGGASLEQDYSASNHTIQTIATDIAGNASGAQIQLDAAGLYNTVALGVSQSASPISLQAYQSAVEALNALGGDLVGTSNPSQIYLDTEGALVATLTGQLQQSSGNAIAQSQSNFIDAIDTLSGDAISGAVTGQEIEELTATAAANLLGSSLGQEAQTAYTATVQDAETLSTDVNANAPASQILVDSLTFYAGSLAEFNVFNGNASTAAYNAVLQAGGTLNADIAAGNASALQADVNALVAAIEAGDSGPMLNSAAWGNLPQSLAPVILDLQSGAGTQQTSIDAAVLYAALIGDNQAFLGTPNQVQSVVNITPATVASNLAAGDVGKALLLGDALQLANIVADPCPGMGPPPTLVQLLDNFLKGLGYADTLGSIFNLVPGANKGFPTFGGALEQQAKNLEKQAINGLKDFYPTIENFANNAAKSIGVEGGAELLGAAAGVLDGPLLGAGLYNLWFDGMENYYKANGQEEAWQDFLDNNPLGIALDAIHNLTKWLDPIFLIRQALNGIADLNWQLTHPTAQAYGEVHLITYDGLHYDFQATGEFVLTESTTPGNSFQIQTRLEPWTASASVTKMTMIGAQLGSDRVTFAIDRPNTVSVDGTPFTLTTGASFNLSGGTLTEVSQSTYRLDWNTGESLTVTNYETFLNANVTLGAQDAPGTLKGLMGPDLGQGSDFQLADGTVLSQPLTSGDLYGEYANAWRISQANSLLDYGPGQTTATFSDVNFPTDAVSLSNLPQTLVNQTAATVAAAGITDPNLSADAQYDFLATGDPNFITGAAGILRSGPTTGANVTPTPPASVAGVIAMSAKVVENGSGATPVSFQVYLTNALSTDTPINYTVVAPGAGFLDAAAFGGTLPSGQVTIPAGQSSAQFTINLPASALGSLPSEDLSVQISTPGGVPIFASTATTTVVNGVPVAGNAAVPLLELPSNPGALQHSGNAYTLNLGTLPYGQMPNFAFAIVNAASAQADDLTGGFTTSGSGVVFNGDVTFPAIAPGQVYSGLSATAISGHLGSNSETLTFTPEQVNASGYSAVLPSITLTINYSVALSANAAINSQAIINFGNARTGAVLVQPVSVSNTGVAGSAGLDASFALAGAAIGKGTISQLAPGATDTTSLSVGLNSTQVGVTSGLANVDFTSDTGGGNTLFLETQAIEVLGSFFRSGTASIPGLFAHAGDPQSQAIVIVNSDPADGFSEDLTATVAGTTGSVVGSGSSTGNIAPQSSSSAIRISYPTTATGVVGSITLDLGTDGTGIDGLGPTDLGPVTLPVTINNLAQSGLIQLSGGGTLAQVGNNYTLDLGSIDQGTGPVNILLAAKNIALGPADLLSGSFHVSGDSSFGNGGFTPFSGLGAGQSDSGLSIALSTTATGDFSETITLDPVGSNASGYSGALATQTLTITGSVVPCFLAGTRISTERGEIAVEELRRGERVQVLSGASQPVVWIGERWVDCRRQPDPRKVWPVRVRAGAFGPGRPGRHLYLSPDHALYVGDALIPVKYLINGGSIAQVAMDEVRYYHVELPRHCVLLAEGLAAESYLDIGDRSTFTNSGGPVALYPDFGSRVWDAEGCAPLVVTGPELEAARQWVNAMARSKSVAVMRAA